MQQRLSELEDRLKQKDHTDLFLQAKHTIQALDDLVNEHRKFTSMQAISGVKIEGNEEVIFYTTIQDAKKIIVSTLEKTVSDLENKWDKHYENNFKDGVE